MDVKPGPRRLARQRQETGCKPLRVCGLCVALCLSFLAVDGRSEIYKYKDHKGVTVFTDTPRGTTFVKVDLKPKGWIDPTLSASPLVLRKKMAQYKPFIEKAALDYSLPESLLEAVITVESASNPLAVSSAGAMGLMQLMPGTAERFGVRDSFSPNENITGGSKYLSHLMTLFDGDLNLVLAAYNAGEGAVKKYGNTVPPYTETQNYVRKVRHYHRMFSE